MQRADESRNTNALLDMEKIVAGEVACIDSDNAKSGVCSDV